MSRSEAVWIAVVGAGGWGKNHVRNYAAIPEAELRYICDRHKGIRDTMAALYPSAASKMSTLPHFSTHMVGWRRST